MKLNFKNIAFILLSIFMNTNSFATEQCSGTVKKIAISSSGEVRLITSFRENYFTICSLHGSWKDISDSTCKAWLSEAHLAYASENDIRIFFPDGTDCTKFMAYQDAPKASWIILD